MSILPLQCSRSGSFQLSQRVDYRIGRHYCISLTVELPFGLPVAPFITPDLVSFPSIARWPPKAAVSRGVLADLSLS